MVVGAKTALARAELLLVTNVSCRHPHQPDLCVLPALDIALAWIIVYSLVISAPDRDGHEHWHVCFFSLVMVHVEPYTADFWLSHLSCPFIILSCFALTPHFTGLSPSMAGLRLPGLPASMWLAMGFVDALYRGPRSTHRYNLHTQ